MAPGRVGEVRSESARLWLQSWSHFSSDTFCPAASFVGIVGPPASCARLLRRIQPRLPSQYSLAVLSLVFTIYPDSHHVTLIPIFLES